MTIFLDFICQKESVSPHKESLTKSLHFRIILVLSLKEHIFLFSVEGCGYETTCPRQHVFISTGLPDNSDDFQMWFFSENINNPETLYVHQVLMFN